MIRFAKKRIRDDFRVCESGLRSGFRLRGQGRFFRFDKNASAGETPNMHSVQHFWLCEQCCQELTLECQDGVGVVIKSRSDIVCEAEILRFIAAA